MMSFGIILNNVLTNALEVSVSECSEAALWFVQLLDFRNCLSSEILGCLHENLELLCNSPINAVLVLDNII